MSDSYVDQFDILMESEKPSNEDGLRFIRFFTFVGNYLGYEQDDWWAYFIKFSIIFLVYRTQGWKTPLQPRDVSLKLDNFLDDWGEISIRSMEHQPDYARIVWILGQVWINLEMPVHTLSSTEYARAYSIIQSQCALLALDGLMKMIERYYG